MTSQKPYFIRALYEWMADNDYTPYLVLDADYPEVHIPREYVRKRQITLNISEIAIRDLEITNNEIFFKTSFNQEIFEVYAPIAAVLSIFAQENGQGMSFPKEKPGKVDGGKSSGKITSHLSIVE